jgi:hypothetical protein
MDSPNEEGAMDRDKAKPGAAERRSSPRQSSYLIAELKTPLRTYLAVTQDLSRTGAKLLAQGRFQDGGKVDLTLLPERSTNGVHLRGRVVRGSAFDGSGPWRWAMAVRFDSPLPMGSVLLVEQAH